MEPDPTVIRSVAVHLEDVVAAVQSREEGRPAVLRVTPPFSGRMRARLHIEQGGNADALHLYPDDLLDDDAPEFPTPAGTEDRLRAADRPYTPENHRELHLQRVAEWREAVREHVVDSVVVGTPAGSHEMGVLILGGGPRD